MEKIAICIENNEDATIIQSLLSPLYVVENMADKSFPFDFDLGIFDIPNLKRHELCIQSLKERAQPLFIPILLLSPPAYLKLDELDIWQSIDEILTTPIHKRTLFLHCKILLRTRKLSLNFKTQQNLLEIQNQTLKEKENDYHQLFNSIEGAFIRFKVVFDKNDQAADAIIIDINDAYEQIAHLKRDQAIGKSIISLQNLPTNISQEWIKKNWKIVQMNPLAEVFFDKEVNHYFSEYIFITKPHFLNLLYFDITERKLMEEFLIRLQKMEALGVLTAGIAHDFNNLLTVIMSSISIMKYYMTPKDQNYSALLNAEKATLRAQNITSQLVTFAKGGDPLKKVISLKDLIPQNVSLVLHGTNTKFEIDVTPDLWSIAADEGQISRVIENLVINAKDAMHENGLVIIKVENHYIQKSKLPLPDGPYIKISVKDHGKGIEKTQIPLLFDPFYSTKSLGRGLGLSSASTIIKRHNGFIDVESEVGKGSTFIVYLPAIDNATPIMTKKMKKTFRILLMDDEELILENLVVILTILGFDVQTSVDSRQAISLYQQALAENRCYDLVILDLTIPGDLGGNEVAKVILNINPNAKIIVSSGYADEPVIKHYHNYGFCAVLQKPYDIDNIKQLLNAFVPDYLT
jgi:nitrogen-specific signal transduction histidine kinase